MGKRDAKLFWRKNSPEYSRFANRPRPWVGLSTLVHPGVTPEARPMVSAVRESLMRARLGDSLFSAVREEW